MIQDSLLFNGVLKTLIMRVFRLFCVVCVILILGPSGYCGVDNVGTSSFDLSQAYKSKSYQEIVDHFKTVKRSLTVKERMMQALSYDKLGDLDKKLQSLREASKQHDRVDLFKRELAKTIEAKADSYVSSANYSKIKTKLYSEASQILGELYESKPSADNFTALIRYYNRQNFYEESVALLNVYARSQKKGKTFYTYLCEAQFKASLFNSALKSCGKLVELRPDYPEGHLLHSQTISKLGEKELADQKLVKLAGRFPASAPVQLEAGKVLIESGNSEKGLEHLEKHLKVQVSDEALVLKADTQFKKGAEAEALETFIRACKQHKEPRRPLLKKLTAAHRSLASSSPFKKKYSMELSRCKYSYRPEKKPPKGILGGSYR